MKQSDNKDMDKKLIYSLENFIKFDIFYRDIESKLQKSRNATDEAFEGLRKLSKMMKSRKNLNYEQKRGFIFEILEGTKFNIEAAKEGKEFRAFITDAEGRPHDAADIEIRDKNGSLLRRIQAKAYKKPSEAARVLSDPKYSGMQRITTIDTAEKAKELSERRANSNNIYSENYRDSYENISLEGASYDGISSGGVTESELLGTTKGGTTQKKIENDRISDEMKNAVAFEIITEGIESAFSNFISFCKDEKNAKNAFRDVEKDILKASGRGVIKTKIRTFGSKNNIPLFSKKAFYEPFSEGIVEVGSVIFAWVQGEKSDEELKDDMTLFAIRYSIGLIAKNTIKEIGLPLGLYTVFEQGCLACISLMEDYNKSEAEYKRLQKMYQIQSKMLVKYQADINAFFENSIKNQKALSGRIAVFCNEYNIDVELEYISAINTNIGADKVFEDYNDFKKKFKKKKGIEWVR